MNFYPRPPRGGRHRRSGKKTIQKHFYPRPPRGGRLAVVRRSKRRSNISIHALHEEGDSATRRPGPSTGYFYPRPPRGGRQSGRAGNNPDKRFLSTPSARRATHLTMLLSSENHISIHALREEGDKDTEGQKQQMNIFLSTPSARRATRLCVDVVHHGVAISIHALREEGDAAAARATARPANFYPRHPRGGRQFAKAVSLEAIKFLSTPSARRATHRRDQ